MADIKWISATAANFSTASAWQGGTVPGVGDTAIFDGGGVGDCTLDAPIEIGPLTFAAGYSGTFATNGYSMSVGGFDTGTASISGKIDLGASTITNNGPVDLRGVQSGSNLIDSQATWIQRGGTAETPNEWQAVSASYYRFASVLFDAGSYTTLLATNAYYNYCEIHVRGNIIKNSGIFLASRGGITMYATGRINNAGTTRCYNGYISGYAENIVSQAIYLQGVTITDPLAFDTDVMITSGTSLFQNACSFRKGVTFGSSSSLSVKFSVPSYFYGDVNATNANTISIDGELILAGTADQSIDLAAVSDTVSIAAQKTAGNVTITSGDFALVNASDFGGILAFAAGYSGTFATNGFDVAFGGFDAGQAVSGTINLGTSTIRNRGYFDGRGILTSLLKTDNCNWRQEGGDRDTGIVAAWQDVNGRDRRFASLEFVQNSYTSWVGSSRLKTKVTADGKMTVATVFRISDESSELVVGEHADITGTSYLLLANCSGSGGISGHTNNIATNYINVRGSTGHVSGSYHVPVRLENYDGGNAIINVSDATFNALLRLPIESTDTAATLTIRFNDVRVAGDLITTKKSDSQAITVDGEIAVTGTGDQTIDLGAANAAIELTTQKPAGNMTLYGNAILADDSIVASDLINRGTLDVPAGLMITTGRYVDTATGSLTGGGTLKTRAILQDLSV